MSGLPLVSQRNMDSLDGQGTVTLYRPKRDVRESKEGRGGSYSLMVLTDDLSQRIEFFLSAVILCTTRKEKLYIPIPHSGLEFASLAEKSPKNRTLSYGR